MRVYNLFFAAVLLLFTFSCQNTSKKPNANKPTTRDTLNQESKYVQQIPDSLRTPEQKKLAKQLLEISIDHVKVVDNRMVFDMSRDEFLKTGVSVEYYALFKKSVQDNNRYIEEQDIKNVDEMLKEYRRNTRKVLENKYKE